MSMPSPTEWIIILVLVFILFGAKRLPDIARGFGEGVREFKKALNDVQEEVKNADKPEEKK